MENPGLKDLSCSRCCHGDVTIMSFTVKGNMESGLWFLVKEQEGSEYTQALF